MISVTTGSAELDRSKTLRVISLSKEKANKVSSNLTPLKIIFFMPLEGYSCCIHLFPLLTAIDEKETGFLITALNKVSGDGGSVCDHYLPVK